MITKTVKPLASTMGAQRRTCMRTILIDEIVATENLARVKAQRSCFRIEQRRREDNLVEQVPSSFETQCTFTRSQHIPPGIIEVALSHLTNFTLGSLTFSHRGILRVVVQITHNQKFLVRILFHQRVFHSLQLSATVLTIIRGSTS